MAIGTSTMGRPLSDEGPQQLEGRTMSGTSREKQTWAIRAGKNMKPKRKRIKNPYSKNAKAQENNEMEQRTLHQLHIPFPKQKKRLPPRTSPSGPIPEEEHDRDIKANMHWGNSMNCTPEKGLERIYFININGLRAARRFEDAMELFVLADGAKITMLGMAETNVPWQDKEVKDQIQSRMFQCWGQSTMTTSQAKARKKVKKYQPGGTGIFMKDSWTTRVIECSEDSHKMGRWSTIRLQGKATKKMAIITGYRVTENDVSRAGSGTAYANQWYHLRAKGHEKPDPREQFFVDLEAYIKELRKDNHAILLMMDANESTKERNSRVAKFFADCDMVDLMEHHHANLPDPPNTYIRGTKTVDYFGGTEDVAEATELAGIEAFGQTFQSDHRGMFLDLRISRILNGQPADLGALQPRGVNAKDPTKIIPFQKAVTKYCKDHKLIQRKEKLEQFMDKEDLPPEQEAAVKKLMNGIDKDVTRSFEHGTKKCSRKHKIPWSPKLMNAKRTIQYWKLWESEIRNKINYLEQ
jgi:exonuclease III